MPRKSNKLATIATAAAVLVDSSGRGVFVSGAKNKNGGPTTHIWVGREDVGSNLMQVDASNRNRRKSTSFVPPLKWCKKSVRSYAIGQCKCRLVSLRPRRRSPLP
ncbi:unnamed protein product [Amoebophrya sp. A120]|nr:unnamed protein product [Amoebophrya sp. A120]|eukprot:GSA120T00009153001.1